MAKGTLSIFVDESGIFKYPDPLSRFYILSLVLHDQSQDISRPLADLSRGVADLGFDPDDFVFHAGPIIRKEDGYSLLSRHWRSRVFDRSACLQAQCSPKAHAQGNLVAPRREPQSGGYYRHMPKPHRSDGLFGR